jgi:uncharacterized protein YjiS (DUF1127 family)
MMFLLSLASQMLRPIRNRRAFQAMTELDDRTLADIGPLRTDIRASLVRRCFADPSKVLNDVCCNSRTFGSRFRSSSEPVARC